MPRHKRSRGGQPGNRNACKHGFYSTNMTPEEIEKFREATKNDNKDPALTALRLKVEASIGNAPGNYRVLREGACLLARYCNSKLGCDQQESTILKKAFRNVLKAAATGGLNLTQRMVSESLKEVEKLPND